jgi:2,3,4,5-tetrahydropyridine-2,6-dicarboxylate N-succinyltransferase
MSSSTIESADPRAQKIHRLYEQKNIEPADRTLIEQVIDDLDQGKIRVAEKVNGSDWVTHEWIKKSVLLYFRIRDMSLIQSGDIVYWDKIPLKKWTGTEGVRAVPTALVRRGAYVAKGCVLMPSYTNIGAHVGSGTMVDTWATVGSCAQIGMNCHLSGGVGIGGVLEPLQASPVIIEDNCFIGSRVIVVEGVHVGESAVIGAGVVLTASTQIIDVTGPQEKVFKGRIPARSVVIPGTRQKKFPAGEFGVPCALIIGQRTSSTDLKTSLNQALRDFEVSV